MLLSVCLTSALAHEQIGRFQIVEVQLDLAWMGKPTILRIDTVTGQVCYLSRISVDVPIEKQQGEMKSMESQGWHAIPADAAVALREVQAFIESLPVQARAPRAPAGR